MIIENNVRLLLDAGHAEYMPTTGHIEVIWAPLDEFVEPLESDAVAAEALRIRLRAKYADWAPALEPYDPTWCQVIEWAGTQAQADAAFDNLLEQVAHVPSGDDDTFDYWPSGARLLLQIASDLDRIDIGHPKGRRWDAACQWIREVLTAKGDLADELRDKIPGLES